MIRKLFLATIFVIILIGMLGSSFKVQRVGASGTIYIRADGSVEGTDKISNVNNVTYTFTDNIYEEIVVERSNIIIDGAAYTVQCSGTGFHWSGINNVTIKNTNIKNSQYGIWLNSSSDNSISNNNIANNDDGIYLDSSSGNIISGNNITASSSNGILLYASSYNSIFGNNIANNPAGILLGSSSNNSVSGNNITANDSYGIHLENFSSDNNISRNNIANNVNGIYLTSSSSNSIYHNNFIQNDEQVHDSSWELPGFIPSINIWGDGYPSGGNYWSDYTGVDANGDGIGDSPYVIDENNQDDYPLISPWSPTWSPKTPVEAPFWMQWWLWVIVAVVIVALARAVYFLKKRKPPTPTAPPSPAEGT